MNPFLINLLGYSHDELIGRKLWQVGAFEDVEARRCAFSVLQKAEYICYDDLPLRTKDGSIIDVEFVSNEDWVGNE